MEFRALGHERGFSRYCAPRLPRDIWGIVRKFEGASLRRYLGVVLRSSRSDSMLVTRVLGNLTWGLHNYHTLNPTR